VKRLPRDGRLFNVALCFVEFSHRLVLRFVQLG
jgi:hypothetical protein